MPELIAAICQGWKEGLRTRQSPSCNASQMPLKFPRLYCFKIPDQVKRFAHPFVPDGSQSAERMATVMRPSPSRYRVRRFAFG